MDTVLSISPNFLLGLIGWAATTKLIMDAMDLKGWQERFLIAFAWLLWMVPAFDVTVYQGSMQANTALLYGTLLTVGVVALISLSGIRWHHRHHR
jgi:hypothetical protein